MLMKFRVIEKNPAQNQIVVRYYTDTLSEAELATDILDGVVRRARWDRALTLPIPSPRGQELERLIFSCAPWNELDMEQKMKTVGPDVEHIALNIEHTKGRETHDSEVKVARILADEERKNEVPEFTDLTVL